MTDRIISISNKNSHTPGSFVTIPVLVNDINNINSFDLEIEFNNQVLDFISVQKSSNLSNWNFIGNLKNDYTIKVLSYSSNQSSEEFGFSTLCELNFRVKNNVSTGANSPLNLQNVILATNFGNQIQTVVYDGLFTVTEQPFINSDPVLITTINNQNIEQNQPLNFTIPSNTFLDNDNETLLYSANLIGDNNSLTKLPNWLNFNPQTKTFTGTPDNDDIGSYNLKIKAADGQGKIAETEFTITVENVNDIPTLINPIKDSSIIINNQLSDLDLIVDGTFEDVDGDILTYSVTLEDDAPLPTWLNFDAENLTFSGVPTLENIGDYNIKIQVDDGNEGIATDTFILKVIESNNAPILIQEIPDREATEDQLFSFDVGINSLTDYFTDPDFDPLTYSASLPNNESLPNWLNFSNTGRFFSNPNPRNEDVTTEPLVITVTASDGKGGEISDTFNLTVRNVNDQPERVKNILDQNTTQNTPFSYTIPADNFSDEDGDILSYYANLSDNSPLPNWLIFNPNNLTFSGTPTDNDLGTIPIKVTVTDGNSDPISDIFNLTVRGIADLLATNFEVVSPKVIAGKTEVNFTIKNQGLADSSAFNVDILYSQDANIDRQDLVIETLTFEGLTVNETKTESNLEINIPRDTLFNNTVNNSTGYLGLIIYDPTEELLDSNFDNNSNQGESLDLDIITPFPWDINGDNIITSTDLIYVINRIGQTVNNDNILADINGDNSLNSLDAITVSEYLNSEYLNI